MLRKPFNPGRPPALFFFADGVNALRDSEVRHSRRDDTKDVKMEFDGAQTVQHGEPISLGLRDEDWGLRKTDDGKPTTERC
jgi:hypothetical protein